MEVTIKLNEDRRQFAWDVFVTALEGGIGYWSACNKYHHSNGEQKDIEGFYAEIEDVEDETEKWRVDYSVIEKGLKLICEGKVQVNDTIKGYIVNGFLNNDAGMIDADGADCIVQAGLFGELVYG